MLKTLSRHFPDGVPSRGPIVTARAVSSSDALMKDTALLEQWLGASRQIAAVEMELSGVYQAARTSDREYPIIAIRGISDIVGFKRRDEFTAYACHTAASFAKAFISTAS